MCVTDRCGAKQNNNIVIRIDMKKRLTLTFWGMLVAFSVMAEAVKVTSPDGEYEFTVSDDGQLSYSLFLSTERGDRTFSVRNRMERKLV